jgi:formylglycine-generating enzyme required for sulfatase activity
MIRVPAGEMRPFYRATADAGVRVPVAAFELDARPVSNADFLAFVRAQPD